METENTTGKKKQKRSSAAERAEILEEFHGSGLTRIAFSRTHNIALSTLSKWLFNAKRQSKAAAPVLFRELRTPQIPMAAGTTWAVEIVGPDGLVIRCREALSLQDVSWLLRGR
jgi:transposase-like protein